MYLRRVVATLFAFVIHPFVAVSVAKYNQKQSTSMNALVLNATALTLFERSRLSYEKSYNFYGRVPADIDKPPNIVTMDFEIETFSMLSMTPELLLQRGGIELGSASDGQETSAQMNDHMPQLNTVWPKVSDYFTLGIDGLGKKVAPSDSERSAPHRKEYRQSFGGQIEIETTLMRPKEVLESSFTKQLQSTMNRLWDQRRNDSKGEYWSPIPFAGAKGIDIHVSEKGNPFASSDSSHVQWTAGLVLEQVPSLLAMTTSKPLEMVLQTVDIICLSRAVGGCAPEYKAFVSLAAWTLKAVRSCGNCAHPKRCLQPWLVRTHLGDLALYLKDRLGANALDHMLVDVLAAAGAKRDDRVLPNGIVDYLRFPEMAEMGGMVFSRGGSQNSLGKDKDMEDMPTTTEGLLQLSKRMMEQRGRITDILLTRGCGIHGKTDAASIGFTAEDWLRGLPDGKDFMSDHDSPISKNSFSHLVWKSMGSWRMKPGSNRVYLECRHTNLCVGIGKRPGAAALIRAVGERMLKFEESIVPEKPDSSTAPKSIVRRESQHGNFSSEIKARGVIF